MSHARILLSPERIGRSCSERTVVSVRSRWHRGGAKGTRRRTKRVERATRLFSRVPATVGVVSGWSIRSRTPREGKRERERARLVNDGFRPSQCITGVSRLLVYSVDRSVRLSVRWSVEDASARATRVANKRQRYRRVLKASPILSADSNFPLPFAALILLFLACLSLSPFLLAVYARPRLAARRARENISWPSGGSAEAFSQLAVMARPAASVSAN